ncbi:hypothetical protein [Rhodopila sp.]|uniref:hypothetical protein n=1 Tax=Rhodopila sp. TaxID=2480087 RepID=UPI003D0C156F
MTSEPQLRESGVLRNLRQVSEARGLKFYVNPPREMVPAFLGDFQPDAMAVGPDGGIIIEVRPRAQASSKQQLATIARRVSRERGWEFRAIYLNPPIDEAPSIARPTAEQLRAALSEIDGLASAGHLAAAFVTGWAALESLARLADTNGEARISEGLSPIRTIQGKRCGAPT